MKNIFASIIFLLSFQSIVRAEQIGNKRIERETSKSSLLFSQITGSTVALCEAYLSGFIDQEDSSKMIKAYLNRLDKKLGSDWLAVPKLENSKELYIYKPSKYVQGILLKKFPDCSNLIIN